MIQKKNNKCCILLTEILDVTFNNRQQKDAFKPFFKSPCLQTFISWWWLVSIVLQCCGFCLLSLATNTFAWLFFYSPVLEWSMMVKETFVRSQRATSCHPHWPATMESSPGLLAAASTSAASSSKQSYYFITAMLLLGWTMLKDWFKTHLLLIVTFMGITAWRVLLSILKQKSYITSIWHIVE